MGLKNTLSFIQVILVILFSILAITIFTTEAEFRILVFFSFIILWAVQIAINFLEKSSYSRENL